MSKKILCALKNPQDKNDRSWLYNSFLGRNRKEKKVDRLETKVNFLLVLTEKEIKELEERGAEIIQIANDIEIDLEDDKTKALKESFLIMHELIEKLLQYHDSKIKIEALLKKEDHKLIRETRELIE